MNVFVWTWIENLTNRWHSEGGLVVVAKVPPTEWYVDGRTFPLPHPDYAYPILPDDVEPRTFVFPDSGCC